MVPGPSHGARMESEGSAVEDPDGDESEPESDQRRRVSEETWAKCRLLGVRIAVIALLGTVALMVLKLAPHQATVKENPGFIDVVFGSRAVVAAVRTLIIFGSAYMALSVLALIWNQHWVTGLAGAHTGKIERSVSGLDEERERLATRLAESKETIQGLEDRLGAVLTELEETAKTLDIVLAERHSQGSGVLRPITKRWRQRGGSM